MNSTSVLAWSKPMNVGPFGNNLIPENAGVYVIGVPNGSGIYYFYVGQAENLRERYRQHSSNENNLVIRQIMTKTPCLFQYALTWKQDLDYWERTVFEELTSEGFRLVNDPTKIPRKF